MQLVLPETLGKFCKILGKQQKILPIFLKTNLTIVRFCSWIIVLFYNVLLCVAECGHGKRMEIVRYAYMENQRKHMVSIESFVRMGRSNRVDCDHFMEMAYQ